MDSEKDKQGELLLYHTQKAKKLRTCGLVIAAQANSNHESEENQYNQLESGFPHVTRLSLV